MIAINLATGNSYALDPVITKSIDIYPTLLLFLLSGVYLIFGPSVISARLAQDFLGSLIAFIFYILGARMFASSVVGILAALGAIFYPLLLVFGYWLHKETVYIFLISLTLLLFYYLSSSRKKSFVY